MWGPSFEHFALQEAFGRSPPCAGGVCAPSALPALATRAGSSPGQGGTLSTSLLPLQSSKILTRELAHDWPSVGFRRLWSDHHPVHYGRSCTRSRTRSSPLCTVSASSSTPGGGGTLEELYLGCQLTRVGVHLGGCDSRSCAWGLGPSEVFGSSDRFFSLQGCIGRCSATARRTWNPGLAFAGRRGLVPLCGKGSGHSVPRQCEALHRIKQVALEEGRHLSVCPRGRGPACRRYRQAGHGWCLWGGGRILIGAGVDGPQGARSGRNAPRRSEAITTLGLAPGTRCSDLRRGSCKRRWWPLRRSASARSLSSLLSRSWYRGRMERFRL